MNTQNETASAHLQALIDLRDCGFGAIKIEDAIKLLTIDQNQTEEEQEKTRQILEYLQELWNRHQYPDTVIKLLLLSIYDYAPAIHDCSLEAQCLFFLMLRVQWQNTGYVAVRKKTFGQRLGFNRHKIESKMHVYLQELEDVKAIRAIYIPPRGSDKPAVYQINPDISKIGRGFKPARITLRGRQKDKFKRTKIEIAVGQEQTLICGTLDTIEENEKGDATNTAKTKSKAPKPKASITRKPPFMQDKEIPFNDVDNSDIPEQITIFDILGTRDESK